MERNRVYCPVILILDFMDWLYLAIAIVSEVMATSALKAAKGFTNIVPSIASPDDLSSFEWSSDSWRSIPGSFL